MIKKVSIIIPTFGRYDLISRAIESVISQSYKNKEIIVIDDNTDESIAKGTKNIVLSYKEKIEIVYIKNSHNLGGALSRNEGIKNSNGEYIAFLDDDDYFAPDKLSKQIAFMEKFDYDATLCDMYVIDEKSNLSNKYHRAQCDNAADFLIRGVAMTPMLIVKKTAAQKAGYFDNAVRFQDHIFIIKLIKSGSSIGVLHEPLVYYYEHSLPRISNSNKSGVGYEFRFDKERGIFHLLSESEKKRVLLRQDIIRSKIICAESGCLKATINLINVLPNVRTLSDFSTWGKALIRNVAKKNKRF